MQSNHPSGRLAEGIRARVVVAIALVAAAILALSAATGAAAMDNPSSGKSSVASYAKKHKKSKKHKKKARRGPAQPVQAVVLTPSPGDTTGDDFNVDVSLQARNALGNSLLSNYTNGFLDPTGPDGQGNPAFHPGASANAPGLVVLLSTTPSMDGTPLPAGVVR